MFRSNLVGQLFSNWSLLLLLLKVIEFWSLCSKEIRHFWTKPASPNAPVPYPVPSQVQTVKKLILILSVCFFLSSWPCFHFAVEETEAQGGGVTP